jgi:hypothetical protein
MLALTLCCLLSCFLQIGESVDFYEEDIWWQCVVVKVTPLEVKVSRGGQVSVPFVLH